jgi:hypothetical protein
VARLGHLQLPSSFPFPDGGEPARPIGLWLSVARARLASTPSHTWKPGRMQWSRRQMRFRRGQYQSLGMRAADRFGRHMPAGNELEIARHARRARLSRRTFTALPLSVVQRYTAPQDNLP